MQFSVSFDEQRYPSVWVRQRLSFDAGFGITNCDGGGPKLKQALSTMLPNLTQCKFEVPFCTSKGPNMVKMEFSGIEGGGRGCVQRGQMHISNALRAHDHPRNPKAVMCSSPYSDNHAIEPSPVLAAEASQPETSHPDCGIVKCQLTGPGSLDGTIPTANSLALSQFKQVYKIGVGVNFNRESLELMK
ncbi:hypothetical protein B0H16DRAFT_1468639 [Mycena metata]|uniref:Uncharacterized protein n=1 Tax=Mycena metata TaxID=1033252 RepID=A0AAD7I099_9AGAR|nr:hypothetical protein B0H16DRAFT_1468639 [Mycena metata]